MDWSTMDLAREQQYASAPFLRRLGARIIDLLVNLVLTFVVAIPVGILFIPFVLIADDRTASALPAIAATLCYVLAYVCLEVFLLVRREGQTLGKGLLGMRVVPASNGTSRITLAQAAIRMTIIFTPFVLMSVAGSNPDNALLNALAMIGFLSLVASLILTLIPAINGRAIHDLVAGTRVVRAPKRAIDLKKDFQMAIPGRVDMTKRL